MLARLADSVPFLVVLGALILSIVHHAAGAPRHVVAIALVGAVAGAWWLTLHWSRPR